MTLGTYEAKPVGSQAIETTTVTIESGGSLSGAVDRARTLSGWC